MIIPIIVCISTKKHFQIYGVLNQYCVPTGKQVKYYFVPQMCWQSTATPKTISSFVLLLDLYDYI
jgi:hypothetical protein